MKQVTKAVSGSGRPLRGLNLPRRLAFTEHRLEGEVACAKRAMQEVL